MLVAVGENRFMNEPLVCLSAVGLLRNLLLILLLMLTVWEPNRKF